MSEDQDKGQPKVVNLAEARKRQRTVRAGAQAKKSMNGQAPKPASGGRSIWMYLQLILFLGVMAYLMQLCQSGR